MEYLASRESAFKIVMSIVKYANRTANRNTIVPPRARNNWSQQLTRYFYCVLQFELHQVGISSRARSGNQLGRVRKHSTSTVSIALNDDTDACVSAADAAIFFRKYRSRSRVKILAWHDSRRLNWFPIRWGFSSFSFWDEPREAGRVKGKRKRRAVWLRDERQRIPVMDPANSRLVCVPLFRIMRHGL